MMQMICFTMMENIAGLKESVSIIQNTHGTGCTLSSAIASNLAKGYDLQTAVKRSNSIFQEHWRQCLTWEREVALWIMDLQSEMNM